MREGRRHRSPAVTELEPYLGKRLTWAAVLANTAGAFDVFVFLTFFSPLTNSSARTTWVVVGNALAGVVYLGITLPLGRAWLRRMSIPWREAAREGRGFDAEAREAALLLPKRFALVSALFWFLAAVLAGAGNAFTSVSVGLTVFVTVLLGGVTTGAVCCFLAERILRPLTAVALEEHPPVHPRALGVRARMTLAWTLVTAMPLVGVVGVGIAELAGADLSRTQRAGAVLFFGLLALWLGLLATVLNSHALADPLAGLRQALARVEEGDFDSRVTVDDASEVGLLQAGFNRMTAGLAERERLRDLFGRHVGVDVARAALESAPALGGEEREVAALFVDVVGSTALAADRPPAEVVRALNRFFSVVVTVTEAHQGFVNKFEGDGALCIFGAPTPTDHPASQALAAARDLHARLMTDVPEVEAAIGVSAGRAVAGNVGAEQRFEYTVIGDPVNEASRLCELAKQRGELLLASEAAVSRARPDEAARWRLGDAVTLRGRPGQTRVALSAEAPAVR
jgi:adenylate cyclase